MEQVLAHQAVACSLQVFRKRQGEGNDQKAVPLTFDDGHISNVRIVLPILLEFGFTATFFITTGFIGTSDEWMNWQDIKKLAGSGMDIQAHGHSHVLIDGLPESGQVRELEKPMRILNNHLGVGPRRFSFPGGRYTDFSLSTAWRLGYESLYSSRPGFNSVILSGGERRLINRFVIHQGIAKSAFEKIISMEKKYGKKAKRSYTIKLLLKNIMGNRIYHYIWRILFQGKRV